jgi:hypothetical protein
MIEPGDDWEQVERDIREPGRWPSPRQTSSHSPTGTLGVVQQSNPEKT